MFFTCHRCVAAAVAMLALGSACPASPPPVEQDETTVQAVDLAPDPIEDLNTTVRVRQLLNAEPQLAEARIDVETVGGLVTLRGRVPDVPRREQAARLALSAFGVRRVDNQLWVTSAAAGTTIASRSHRRLLQWI